MKPLPQTFFFKTAPELAQELLGCRLVHESLDGVTAGIIVETEAYSQEDAASHSYKGETARTKAMFGPGGHAYIYFTYGMHYCFNVVSGEAGHGQGVLIRALQPVEGIELMKQRRGKEQVRELCNGPAKLVQAMGISKADYGKPLFQGDLYIQGRHETELRIESGPRVGISKAVDVPWRFWIKDSRFVS
jgi:DNA-3-methyladenine glycosylase